MSTESPLPEDRKQSFSLAELLARRPTLSTWSKLKNVLYHCVYVVRDTERNVLYVGSSKHGPMHRMKQHLSSGRIRFDEHLRSTPSEVRFLWTIDAYAMPSEEMARLVETYAIALLRPVWNDRLDPRAAA